jgi:two-component sensor histidine kinase
VEADALTVDLDFAIPLGLLVTELVLDALRRPEPRDRAGEVRIRLRKSPDGGVTLTVMDNGGTIGSGHGTPHEGGALGLSVVEALVAQLEGEITVVQDDGTKVEVRMPLPEIES